MTSLILVADRWSSQPLPAHQRNAAANYQQHLTMAEPNGKDDLLLNVLQSTKRAFYAERAHLPIPLQHRQWSIRYAELTSALGSGSSTTQADSEASHHSVNEFISTPGTLAMTRHRSVRPSSPHSTGFPGLTLVLGPPYLLWP